MPQPSPWEQRERPPPRSPASPDPLAEAARVSPGAQGHWSRSQPGHRPGSPGVRSAWEQEPAGAARAVLNAVTPRALPGWAERRGSPRVALGSIFLGGCRGVVASGSDRVTLSTSRLGCRGLALALGNPEAWSEAWDPSAASRRVKPRVQHSQEQVCHVPFSLLCRHKEQSCQFARNDLCALQT